MISISKATSILVAFLMGLLVSLPSHGESAEESKTDKSSFYFTTGDKSGTPLELSKTDFDCLDKVYVVANLKGIPAGKHIFTVNWRDPSENTREKTEYEFNSVQTETKLWAWLRLSRARGAGMLTWINPAAGLEEFVGEWSVEVKVDQQSVSTENFTVTC